MIINIKRAYENPASTDDTRILVDRLWPWGRTKEKAGIDVWLKEIAPSTALRQWFGHDPAKWVEFQKRYREELEKNPEQVVLLREQARKGTTALVYGAKDEAHNEALVLQELLRHH